ncbi:ComEC/Rec2 family competence protein [Gephyromycinifex aptenodytis]|uniref:ComEC/Rec2 family competence protein n=1 Tax=Gephyromycinifex aptenodytis TaxID=2716227 RepID=UPI0014462DAA|nr:ComEC/Rec2 family competence protein [Gephyromycinifex aptenodytis]
MNQADARLLLPALLGWAVLAVVLHLPVPVVAAAAAGCLVVALVAAHPRLRNPVTAMCALICCLLLCCLCAAETVRSLGPIEELAQVRASVMIQGRVTGEPVRLQEREVGPEQVAVRVLVLGVQARGQQHRVRSPVLIITTAADGWRWRSQVALRGRLSPAEPGQDVVAVLRVGAGPRVLAGPGPVLQAAEVVRAGLRGAVHDLPEDARGLLPGLVIGDRSQTPPDLADAMKQTGMSHLTAVSGTNVALVGGAALLLARGVGAPRRLRPLSALLVIAGFVVVARPDPSVIRAAVMGTIGLIAVARSRPQSGLPALAGAVIVLLALDPWLARSYGFALSVLATLGLLILARPWAQRWRAFLPSRLAWFADALAVPVAAQVACAPVIVTLQGEITLVGVVANLLAAPLVAPTTIGGVCLAMLAVPAPGLAAVLAWLPGLPALGIARIARMSSAVPHGAVPWPTSLAAALGLAVIIVALLSAHRVLLRWARRRPLLWLAVLAASVVLLWPVKPRDWPGPHPALVACDVGQGDALVLPTSPGHAVLVDAGPDAQTVDDCLRDLRIGVLDAVVLTHFDLDHVGGLDGVSRGRSIGEVVISTQPGRPLAAARVQRWWRAQQREPLQVADGDILTWPGVRATVRNPPAHPVPGMSPNRGSIVLDVTSTSQGGTVRSLLLADADAVAGAAVLRSVRPSLSSGFDVVKVAHHGSADHDPQLLAEARAPVAFISVGADNDYGHPAPTLLRSLARTGAAVYRTDQQGHLALGRRNGALYVAISQPG